VFDEVMRGLVEAASPGFGLHGAALSLLQASRHECASSPLENAPHRNKALMDCQRQNSGENRGELNEDGERPRSITDDIGGQWAVNTPRALSPAFRQASFLP
jgi:hypothetical protein